MISHLHITGLGPHADTEIAFDEPMGHTTIAAHSQGGKSTLIDAPLFALFGVARNGSPFPVEAIRDDADLAEVVLTTGGGKVVTRSINRSRRSSRSMTTAGEVQVFPTEDGFRGALKKLGERPDVARLVLAPMQWQPLLNEKLGRPLRDLLLSLVPGADVRTVVARLMEQAEQVLRDSDPVEAKAAAALQTECNRLRDTAKGRVDAARARLNAPVGKAAAVSQADVDAAHALLAALQKWEAFDAAMRTHEAKAEGVKRQAKDRDAWRARSAALGARPTVDAAAVRVGREGAERLAREVIAAESRVTDLRRQYTTAEAAKKKAADAKDCPTCGRPLDEKIDTSGHEHTMHESAAEGKAAAAKLEQLRKDHEAALAALGPLTEVEGKARGWEAAHRALGTEPVVDVPPTAPQQPEGERPDGGDAARREAEQTIQRAAEAKGAAERAAGERKAAQADLERATAELERAETEAARVVMLVTACRRAPTELASEQAAALGDLGPVTFRFPPKETSTTPEIEMLVDGRPWWLASDGRLVVADLYLRAGIRRLAKLGPLPIIVDRAQDWSEEWPELPGPVWYLVTRPGDMVVRAGRPDEVADG